MTETKLSKQDKYIAAKAEKKAQLREKRREIASKIAGVGEPDIDPFKYKLSLMICINYYNVNADNKKYRDWLNDYLISTDRKKLCQLLNKVSDYDIRSVGMLSRLKLREQYLEPQEEQYIESKIEELTSKALLLKEESSQEISKKPKIDNARDESLLLCEDFEAAIDEFVVNKKTEFSASDYLKSKEVTPAISKKISEYYVGMLNELKSVSTDKELQEGYSNFSKMQMRKFIALIESFVDACSQRVVSAKVKKPRKQKPINPLKVVSKLKYLKSFLELGLNSIKPEKILDSNELWVYNTKYRKLAVYKAESGGKLSVKGTTIIGYDVKESTQVMLRKPEEFFKNVQLAKKALSTGLKSIKTKSVTPNGRLNEETILLGAF